MAGLVRRKQGATNFRALEPLLLFALGHEDYISLRDKKKEAVTVGAGGHGYLWWFC